MGDGSGILVLEELEHALARGAKIYGEVVGYGATADAYHVTVTVNRTGEGAAKAMKIRNAGSRYHTGAGWIILMHMEPVHMQTMLERQKRSSLQWEKNVATEHPDQFHKIYDRTFARCSRCDRGNSLRESIRGRLFTSYDQLSYTG